jgi:hypothetical protein
VLSAKATSRTCQSFTLLANDRTDFPCLHNFIRPIHPLLPLARRDNCIGDSGAAAIVNSLGSFRSHILSVLPAVIDTPDFYEYKPIVKGSLLTDHLEFEVDASNDAHVRLSLKDGGEFEVVIGGWNNKQSVLRASAQGPPISQPFCGVVLEAGKFQRWALILSLKHKYFLIERRFKLKLPPSKISAQY